ncbi:hypothetical protein ACPV5G_17290 [Photobacterium damselae]|uniref:hypothetical protein n=1 Tax=Photobacterium damselae TaxID=38293 RepID=UPI004067E14D
MLIKINELILRALKNEISVDEYLINKFYLNGKNVVYRPLRYKFLNKIPKDFNVIFAILIPVFILFFFIKNIMRKKNVYDDVCDIFLMSSKKGNEIYNEHNIDAKIIKLNGGEYISYLSYIDRLKIIFICMVISYKLLFEIKIKNWINIVHVNELVCFYFFLEHLAEKKTKKIIVTNHYDRWITLLSIFEMFDIEIYQHGIIDPSYYPRYKLPKVSIVHCFDLASKNIFIKNIIKDITDGIYIDISLGKSIEISEEEVDVLLIGNPLYLDLELAIYRKIKIINPDIIIKYRPHPISRKSLLLRGVSLSLNDKIPRSRLVLVKESTLGFELASIGFNVIWLDDIVNIDSFLLRNFKVSD